MKAQMFNDQRWLYGTVYLKPETIKALMDEILEDCDFSILAFTDYRFTPHGYTALWLLGESHLAIHTFPEEETVYVELSSCVYDQYRKYIDIMCRFDVYKDGSLT